MRLDFEKVYNPLSSVAICFKKIPLSCICLLGRVATVSLLFLKCTWMFNTQRFEKLVASKAKLDRYNLAWLVGPGLFML